jgi:hypothetical protein
MNRKELLNQIGLANASAPVDGDELRLRRLTAHLQDALLFFSSFLPTKLFAISIIPSVYRNAYCNFGSNCVFSIVRAKICAKSPWIDQQIHQPTTLVCEHLKRSRLTSISYRLSPTISLE